MLVVSVRMKSSAVSVSRFAESAGWDSAPSSPSGPPVLKKKGSAQAGVTSHIPAATAAAANKCFIGLSFRCSALASSARPVAWLIGSRGSVPWTTMWRAAVVDHGTRSVLRTILLSRLVGAWGACACRAFNDPSQWPVRCELIADHLTTQRQVQRSSSAERSLPPPELGRAAPSP